MKWRVPNVEIDYRVRLSAMVLRLPVVAALDKQDLVTPLGSIDGSDSSMAKPEAKSKEKHMTTFSIERVPLGHCPKTMDATLKCSRTRAMRSGETIGNRKTGETLTMIISEDESGGTRQLYQVRLPPRRPSPPAHYHVRFTETFTVIEGTLDVFLGRRRDHIALHPGESITAHVRQVHTFANDRDEWAIITVDTRPAGGVVKAFQLAYGIANEDGAAKDGLPKNPLARLIFVKTAEGYLPHLPLVFQKVVLSLADSIAKILGLKRQWAHASTKSSFIFEPAVPDPQL